MARWTAQADVDGDNQLEIDELELVILVREDPTGWRALPPQPFPTAPRRRQPGAGVADHGTGGPRRAGGHLKGLGSAEPG